MYIFAADCDPRLILGPNPAAQSQKNTSSYVARVARSLLTFRGVRRYLTHMKTTVSSKGQIVLPAELRQRDRIKPGQEFEVERLHRGDYRLVRRLAHPNQGLVDWLLSCPEKDFFVPIESESTETL